MPLYEMTSNKFNLIQQASFAQLKIKERDDIQRILRTQIEVLGDELYVLTEEFSDWQDSKRRIDLLAIDKEANLVVIELKRTSDGGHMELQAIRYASMVSTMTFERAAQIHSEFLYRLDKDGNQAKSMILDFLDWEEADSEIFADDVRILLVSEDFGKELTTAVLWLRDRDIDIRCIRLRPYDKNGIKLIDVQQIIPLPEAHDYQVKIREKEQEGRKQKAERFNERRKFWEGLISIAKAKQTRHANIKPSEYHWLGASSGVSGLNFNYTILQEHGHVELYIDRIDQDVNKRIFRELHSQKETIEKLFGKPLTWEKLDDKRACRIKAIIPKGGYRSPEILWPEIQSEMVQEMTNLEAALKGPISALKL